MPATPTTSERAYYVPFIAFFVLLVVGQVASEIGGTSWFFRESQYWVKPAQTVLCGALLCFYWRSYDFGSCKSRFWLLGTVVGVAAFLIWIAPEWLFQASKRLDGFDPHFFVTSGPAYWINTAFRFARLVVIVPLIEEIFWRGFLMRWLIKDNFTSVPFGTFQIRAFVLVALLFMLEHGSIDYPAALLTGLLYNALAVRERSLGACVLAHAVTNLLLGLHVMRTGQWGYW